MTPCAQIVFVATSFLHVQWLFFGPIRPILSPRPTFAICMLILGRTRPNVPWNEKIFRPEKRKHTSQVKQISQSISFLEKGVSASAFAAFRVQSARTKLYASTSCVERSVERCNVPAWKPPGQFGSDPGGVVLRCQITASLPGDQRQASNTGFSRSPWRSSRTPLLGRQDSRGQPTLRCTSSSG